MDKQTGVEVQLSGGDGNIFAITGKVSKAMKRGGFTKEAKQMGQEVMAASSYTEALAVISDYVVVE